MTKVENGLLTRIDQNPDRTFSVIVVCGEGVTKETLELHSARILMDRILAAKLSGHEILSLAEASGVIAIEEDLEMSVL